MSISTPCSPHSQSFVWTLRAGDDNLLFRVASASHEFWFEYGLASDVTSGLLGNLNGSDIAWYPWKGALSAQEHRSFVQSAEANFLARLGAVICRPLPPPLWHAFNPFVVLHPQFGPGFAVATDGARVILLSNSYFGCDWFMAHRTNIEVLGKPRAAAHSSGNGQLKLKQKSPLAALRQKLLAEL